MIPGCHTVSRNVCILTAGILFDVFDVMTKLLVWYDHLDRMVEERLPKKMLN